MLAERVFRNDRELVKRDACLPTGVMLVAPAAFGSALFVRRVCMVKRHSSRRKQAVSERWGLFS